MLKSEAAVIPMCLPDNEDITYIVGDSLPARDPGAEAPYSPTVCTFLASLSAELLRDTVAKRHPDVIAFAFWCRKSNLDRLRSQFEMTEPMIRLGLGLVFHIAPSNVPVNFAFSYVISLLAGNHNLVRVPSKKFPQVDVICDAIKRVLAEGKHSRIAEMTKMFRYNQNDEITAALSDCCNARVIWGGDETIRHIRKIPTPVRAVEVAFSDRYSLCALGANGVLEADQASLQRLAEMFYNDTYLMDQNACSSPHLVIWIGEDSSIRLAQERFWESVATLVRAKYDLAPVKAIDKFHTICKESIELQGECNISFNTNYLYRIELDRLSPGIENHRGAFGCFYEYLSEDLECLVPIINNRFQTLTYFGLDIDQFKSFISNRRPGGVDRIVPIGSSLDIGVFWDGYDLIRTLSRVIEVN